MSECKYPPKWVQMKGYKQRLLLTKQQERVLSNYFGASRWVYNRGLAMINDHYQEHKKALPILDVNKKINELRGKEEFKWLRETPSTVTNQAWCDLKTAMTNFYRKVVTGKKLGVRKDGKLKGFPRFKKKTTEQSCRFAIDNRIGTNMFRFGENLRLPTARGFSGLGEIRVKWTHDTPVFANPDEPFPKMITISKSPAGKYYISFMLRVVIIPSSKQTIPQPTKATPVAIGIDLGLKTWVTTSTGEQFDLPKFYQNKQRSLSQLQKRKAATTKGSYNNRKLTTRIAKLHEHIANQRRDATHKLTTSLIQKYDIIATEDLNVAAMKRGLRLGKAISNAGFAELVEQLRYKAIWYGKRTLRVGRFDTTTKVCHKCGTYHPELRSLSARRIVCSCGLDMDRDHNAAINILTLGAGKSGLDGEDLDKVLHSLEIPHIYQPIAYTHDQAIGKTIGSGKRWTQRNWNRRVKRRKRREKQRKELLAQHAQRPLKRGSFW